MWGIVPAAGLGSRMQPLAFSKELLPVGSRRQGEIERPRAVSEHLLDRMVGAGARKICFVIAPAKSDIVSYYGGAYAGAHLSYVVQGAPAGLCDAVFRAIPLIGESEPVLLGLPDTVWFPESGFDLLGSEGLSLLLFPVARPELFDAVVYDESGAVLQVQVKTRAPQSPWVWGAMKMRGVILHQLHELWRQRERADVYLGTLINAYLERGGEVRAVRGGEAYVDVGTLNGYREAISLLAEHAVDTPAALRVPAYTASGRAELGEHTDAQTS